MPKNTQLKWERCNTFGRVDGQSLQLGLAFGRSPRMAIRRKHSMLTNTEVQSRGKSTKKPIRTDSFRRFAVQTVGWQLRAELKLAQLGSARARLIPNAWARRFRVRNLLTTKKPSIHRFSGLRYRRLIGEPLVFANPSVRVFKFARGVAL